MPTPSGTISLSNVNTELGYSATALISMNDAAVRSLAEVPSGAISMQNLQNKSSIVVANLTIAANTANYVLNTAKVTGYAAGKTQVTLTINSGVYIYSVSTGTPALEVDASWATGDTITIVNNGTILGAGGQGGGSNSGGNPGGTGLQVQKPASINNANRISGGGGGGGGGASTSQATFIPAKGGGGTTYIDTAVGGGGGGGIGNGAGGPNATNNGVTSQAGSPGTLIAAGGGGSGARKIEYAPISAGNGGTGGTFGASGSTGGSGSNIGGTVPGASAGAGGPAVSGNSYITWIATGTRNGSIS